MSAGDMGDSCRRLRSSRGLHQANSLLLDCQLDGDAYAGGRQRPGRHSIGAFRIHSDGAVTALPVSVTVPGAANGLAAR